MGIAKFEEEKCVINTTDWMDNYNNMRRAVFPDWITIECIIWSEVHKSWFILPRYVSANACFGCRLLVIASDDWKDIQYVDIKLKKSKDDEPLSVDDLKRIGVVRRDDVEESEPKEPQAKVIKSVFYNKNGAKGFSA
eukprot:763548_1